MRTSGSNTRSGDSKSVGRAEGDYITSFAARDARLSRQFRQRHLQQAVFTDNDRAIHIHAGGQRGFTDAFAKILFFRIGLIARFFVIERLIVIQRVIEIIAARMARGQNQRRP